MNLIGAHVSGGSSLAKTLEEVAAYELEACQVFLSSPHAFALPELNEEVDHAFRTKAQTLGLRVFVHGPYVMNFGSPKDSSRRSAAQLLKGTLKKAANIGAEGVVLHSGSSTTEPREVGLAHLRSSLLPVLEYAEEVGVPVLLEPMAGQGNMLASTVDTIMPYWEAVDCHTSLALCLDTAHLLAAGEPLDEEGGMTDTLDRLEAAVGLDRVKLVHANDSKVPRGSKKDRHENLGCGFVRLSAWEEAFAHPRLTAPLVLETPSGAYNHDLGVLRAARK